MSDTISGNRSRSTLHDVALRAGVSASTVSLVLTGKAGKRRISQETHTKVFEAANDLGYTPNLLHRSIRRGRTHVLSFYNAFRNREWSDLYMDRMSAGVEHAGGQYGYDVLVHCNYSRSPQETYEFLNGGFADGLILFGPSEYDPLLPLLRASNLPTVLIGPLGEETTLPIVRDDEEEGMRLIAEALCAHGHTQIAALVVNVGILDPTGRLFRLQRELQARGASLPDENVVIWNDAPDNMLAQILALPNRPTAVFVWHDRATYRMLEACDAANVRVPDDLAFVGYDGLVWPSTTPHVAASVSVPIDEIGLAAVRLLDRLIEGKPGPTIETIPVSFLPGTTIGPHVATP